MLSRTDTAEIDCVVHMSTRRLPIKIDLTFESLADHPRSDQQQCPAVYSFSAQATTCPRVPDAASLEKYAGSWSDVLSSIII
jgi:hypothetical protein